MNQKNARKNDPKRSQVGSWGRTPAFCDCEQEAHAACRQGENYTRRDNFVGACHIFCGFEPGSTPEFPPSYPCRWAPRICSPDVRCLAYDSFFEDGWPFWCLFWISSGNYPIPPKENHFQILKGIAWSPPPPGLILTACHSSSWGFKFVICARISNFCLRNRQLGGLGQVLFVPQ